MLTVSFYSYKGGLGRTMALLNVAWYLAKNGSRVLIWDMDLEAPGLHQAYLHESCCNEEKRTKWERPEPQDGFKEFAEACEDRTRPNVNLFTEGLGPSKNISLLRAGRDVEKNSYKDFIQTFSWYNFYNDNNVQGRNIIESLIIKFIEPNFDYLLLDARTGFTDVAEITTLQLPDLVVGFTNLSDQSAAGMKQIFEKIDKINEKCRSENGAKERMRGKTNKPIERLLVGSNLPVGEWHLRNRRVRNIEENFKLKMDHAINHIPLLSLGEANQIVFQHLDPELDMSVQLHNGPATDYVTLAEKIVRLNPESMENIATLGKELVGVGRWREALPYLLTCKSSAKERKNEIGKKYIETLACKARAHSLTFDSRSALNGLEDLFEAVEHSKNDLDRQIPATSIRVTTLDDAFDYPRSKGIKAWALAQFALAWEYTLEGGFQKAEKTLVKVSEYLTNILKNVDEGKVVKKELEFFQGFSCMLAGHAAKDQKKVNDAEKQYEKAIKQFQRLDVHPLEEALCHLSLAENKFQIDEIKNIKTCINRGKKSYQKFQGRRGANQSGYIEALIQLREGQVFLASGKFKEACEYFKSAQNRSKDDGDVVGQLDASLNLTRLEVFYGQACMTDVDKDCQNDMNDDNGVNSIHRKSEDYWKKQKEQYNKLEFLRLDDEVQEFLRMTYLRLLKIRFGQPNKKRNFMDFTYKQFSYTFFENNLKRKFKNSVDAFSSLYDGDFNNAYRKLSDITVFDENGQDVQKEWHHHEIMILKGIIYFIHTNSSLNGYDRSLKEYARSLKEKGYIANALQAMIVYSLFDQNKETDNEIKALKAKLVYTPGVEIKEGWALYLYDLLLGKYTEFRSEAKKCNKEAERILNHVEQLICGGS